MMMTRNNLRLAAAAAALSAALLTLGGCRVHEYPTYPEGFSEENSIQIAVRPEFSTQMLDYLTITKSYWDEQGAGYNARIAVQVYRYYADEVTVDKSEPAFSGSVIVSDFAEINKAVITVPADYRKYRVIAWMDFVPEGGTEDLYYTGGDLTNISFNGAYVGSEEHRDAFRGASDVDLSRYQGVGITIDRPVKMTRPLGKFRVLALDRENFISQYNIRHGIAPAADSETKTDVNLDDFTVVFTYVGYAPSAYDAVEDVSIDAESGLEFTSGITDAGDGTLELGYDYVFADAGGETTVTVSVALYEQGYESPLSQNTFAVPLRRGGITTVTGNFLTSSGGGGITVSPQFDGENEIYF